MRNRPSVAAPALAALVQAGDLKFFDPFFGLDVARLLCLGLGAYTVYTQAHGAAFLDVAAAQL